MKFVFKILFFISLSTQARELVVIGYPSGQSAQAAIVRGALINQLALPSSFIQSHEGSCQILQEAIATICVDENGDIEVKQQNSIIMQRLLVAFGETNEHK